MVVRQLSTRNFGKFILSVKLVFVAIAKLYRDFCLGLTVRSELRKVLVGLGLVEVEIIGICCGVGELIWTSLEKRLQDLDFSDEELSLGLSRLKI